VGGGHLCCRPFFEIMKTAMANKDPAPSLSLQGISKSFPGVRALHNVNLSLYPSVAG